MCCAVLQLYRRAKCKDVVVRIDSPIVRRTILAISGKVVEAANCKSYITVHSIRAFCVHIRHFQIFVSLYIKLKRMKYKLIFHSYGVMDFTNK